MECCRLRHEFEVGFVQKARNKDREREHECDGRRYGVIEAKSN